eukprot:TRINITY_DN4205_c0_g1_i15.p1 TRINITY_DN4205_c0_g1~~TRINITY_DN4205_c0_g1_i15.p1  ORF type:complete len:404 (+),score=38.04 TRINITY_DN4205_c0_g1_i15:505-1716(+)
MLSVVSKLSEHWIGQWKDPESSNLYYNASVALQQYAELLGKAPQNTWFVDFVTAVSKDPLNGLKYLLDKVKGFQVVKEGEEDLLLVPNPMISSLKADTRNILKWRNLHQLVKQTYDSHTQRIAALLIRQARLFLIPQEFQAYDLRSLYRVNWPTKEFEFKGYELGDKLVDSMIEGISEMSRPGLGTSLRVEWYNYIEDINPSCTKVFEALKQAWCLFHLHFDFNGTNFRKEGCEALAELFKHCPQLTNLSLDLIWCKSIDDTALILLGKGLSKLTLFELHLKIPSEKLTDKGFSEFSKLIRSQAHLSVLSTEFWRNKCFTEKGYSDYADTISKMSSLTCLDINWKDTNLSGQSLLRLIDKNTRLTKLVLNLEYTRVNDDKIVGFCKHLAKLSHLTSLSIDLHR